MLLLSSSILLGHPNQGRPADSKRRLFMWSAGSPGSFMFIAMVGFESDQKGAAESMPLPR